MEPARLTTTPKGGQPSLKEGVLDFAETVAQSLGAIAPSVTPALTIPLIYRLVGPATWLAFLLATLGVACLWSCCLPFASRLKDSGSLYRFVSEGLGQKAGVATGWMLSFGYLGAVASLCSGVPLCLESFVGESRNFWQNQVQAQWVVSFTALLAAWFMSSRNVQFSIRSLLASELFSLACMALVLVQVIRAAPGPLPLEKFWEPTQTNRLGSGVMLAVLAFAGFESAASLAVEAKRPQQSIPWAMGVSLFSVGAFFLFASYALVLGFSLQKSLPSDSTIPLVGLARHLGLGSLQPVLLCGPLVSSFAGSIACFNAASRLYYAMALDGWLPRCLTHVHRKHVIPDRALGLGGLLVLSGLSFGFVVGGNSWSLFEWFALLSGYGFVAAYLGVSLAALRVRTGGRGRGLSKRMVQAFAVVFVAGVLWGNVFPLELGSERWGALLTFLGALGTGWGGSLLFRRSMGKRVVGFSNQGGASP
ncbi:APC family permease [Candidatus Methylacidithermus pantelleriae]|uniref:Putative Amino acid permease-associated region n=1 Tax=Candidatus Methylacidithermus pantelleriae TaxID=2744239 RepID=A0A8J2BRC0_9BACT|nr:APC family permease [Candidatus Methylacidithermus pantelleriae]CAF0700993.1 putative Amino acid permease-associated region [Candidatus Methylacidithermus pantelleriae]